MQILACAAALWKRGAPKDTETEPETGTEPYSEAEPETKTDAETQTETETEPETFCGFPSPVSPMARILDCRLRPHLANPTLTRAKIVTGA